MHTRHILMVLMASAVLAAGCGSEDTDGEPAAKAEPRVDLADRRAELEKNPHDVRCWDIRDRRSTHNTRLVQYALARELKGTGLNPLQASQSVYFALTKICKSRPDSYEPAKAAIAAVRCCRYLAEL